MVESQNASRRGKAFSNEQDVAICKAYLAILEDSIVGNSQASMEFWRKITEFYVQISNDTTRT